MQVKEIDVEGFAASRDGAALMDVRTPKEFTAACPV
jgi:hypothetical protein